MAMSDRNLLYIELRFGWFAAEWSRKVILLLNCLDYAEQERL